MVSKVGGPPGGMPPGAGGAGSAEEDSAIYSQLKKFINVIDELRDVGVHNTGISLPRIAVVGG
jgi:hypothetical protein